mmetsp:Transcript_27920/g.70032  ORF Transcript_27920/g.70032 Transcript_27920/m.70032 type:complete len:381 (+) Transcript_27920:163-1305(+)|eukprot:CAMPEP_0177647570 /NCGR_PEP_ID=MMETSP0447-20121125/10368_1 /TAXON_ID=0 /ORGANISM="Stygamoeba regulata, Strain BSH-02190019" /LENGTH=380 /DNA_ID=CAMNT_0019150159 /DNA_START=163 /DNA_END=1305 /DNA_ORIENTATION=+
MEHNFEANLSSSAPGSFQCDKFLQEALSNVNKDRERFSRNRKAGEDLLSEFFQSKLSAVEKEKEVMAAARTQHQSPIFDFPMELQSNHPQFESTVRNVMSSDNHYGCLGLQFTNTSHEHIKAAYKSLCLILHPDRNRAENKPFAEAAFKKVCAAYEVLKNSERKEEYDRTLQQQQLWRQHTHAASQSSPINPAFQDIFQSRVPPGSALWGLLSNGRPSGEGSDGNSGDEWRKDTESRLKEMVMGNCKRSHHSPSGLANDRATTSQVDGGVHTSQHDCTIVTEAVLRGLLPQADGTHRMSTSSLTHSHTCFSNGTSEESIVFTTNYYRSRRPHRPEKVRGKPREIAPLIQKHTQAKHHHQPTPLFPFPSNSSFRSGKRYHP